MIQVIVHVHAVAVLNSIYFDGKEFFYTWLWKFVLIKDSKFVCSCKLTLDHTSASISYKLTMSICHLLLENAKLEVF